MDIKKRTLTSTEEVALNNDLEGIQDWVDAAINGKVANCKKRMLAKWIPILTADPAVENIPADEDKLIESIVARDDYVTEHGG
jgi:hypothetical protein